MRTPYAIVLAIAILALAAATPASAGVYYEATTTSDSSQGQDSTTRVTTWVEGASARVEFSESDNPLMTTGSYLLTTDGGKTLHLVDPKEKTYMEWDLGSMMGGFGAMLQGMGDMVEFDFSDPEVVKLAEDAGPRLLGHPTTHTRYRTSFTVEMKIFGMSQTMESTTVQDAWSTTAFDAPGLGVWLRNEPPRTGIAELDTFIEKQMETVRGIPLKTVAVTTAVDSQGNETTTTTTTEVVTLREEAVPASRFALPSGYEKVEMPDLSKLMAGQR
jgi:hypothetical protein